MTRSTKLVFSFLMLFILSLNSNGQVPDPALIGYWHNWNTIIAAYVPLDSVDSRYNVINVAFAVPKTGTICDMEFVPYKVNQSTFKAQVDTVRSQGRKVLISIGGGGTLVELKDTNQRKVFVSSVLKIIDTYGFDGIDIDLESGSVTVSGGTIANPVDSKIINLISAIKQISSEYRNKYGRKMMLTMAPETAGVTGGMSKYEGEWGAYLPVIDALRDSIDILHMQLYNSGTMYGIDGKIYTQGTVDFLISQTDAVLRGFDTDGGHFAGLKPEQIAIGMPACVSAAEGGYMNLISVKWSILYLLGKSQQPGEYSLDYKYPTLRGMMTWSINWDKAGSCGAGYEFAHYFDIIFGWRTDVSEDVNIKSNFLLFPNPSSVGETVYICSQEELNKIEIFDWLGRSIKPVNIRYEGSRTSFELNNHLSPGLYFIVCRTASGAVFGEKLIIE